jgi:hypothetical protein
MIYLVCQTQGALLQAAKRMPDPEGKMLFILKRLEKNKQRAGTPNGHVQWKQSTIGLQH